MRVISSYAAGAGVIIMKDIVDEMLDAIDKQPGTGNFMPIPDIGNEPSETVGTKLAKVLRRTTLSPDAVLTVDEVIGMTYNPLTNIYALGTNTDVNYLMRTRRDD